MKKLLIIIIILGAGIFFWVTTHQAKNIHSQNIREIVSERESIEDSPALVLIDIPPTIPLLMEYLLPENVEGYIVEYRESSDGRGGTLASVEPYDDSGKRWILEYDPEDTFNQDGTYLDFNETVSTLIHELGHILMLNDTQVDMVPDTEEYISCLETQILLDEGCAFEDSYITVFANRFWDESDRQEAYEALITESEEAYSVEHYNDHQGWFVSEYAATNEIEDMAESFLYFILQEYPSGDMIYQEKITFFYSYPELVVLKEYLRDALKRIKSV